MTVYLMTGTPGSGKSLHMAKNIYWHVKMGRPVIANFEINEKMFKNTSSFTVCENPDLNPDFLRRYAAAYFKDRPFREGTIKLYIDECQTIFSNREWNAKGRADWVKFFTQHRKFGYDVMLVCQQHEMIDKQIRGLIEYEVMHRKLNNVGWVGKLAGVIFIGHPVVCCVTRWYGMRMRLGSEWMIGTKKYYKLYDTLATFDYAALGEPATI